MRMRYVGIALLLAAGLAAQPPQPPQPPQQMEQMRQRLEQELQRMEQQAQQERRQLEQARQQLEQERRQIEQRGQPLGPVRPSWERMLGGPEGRWWARPDEVQRLTLTADQRRKMDDLYQESRLKLIDLNAAAQKEEVRMERLVTAEQPDATQITAQIDKVTQARANVQKEHIRMVLGIRGLLSQEQWNKLQGAAGGQPPPAAR